MNFFVTEISYKLENLGFENIYINSIMCSHLEKNMFTMQFEEDFLSYLDLQKLNIYIA
jgi:hypothetical protein